MPLLCYLTGLYCIHPIPTETLRTASSVRVKHYPNALSLEISDFFLSRLRRRAIAVFLIRSVPAFVIVQGL